MTLTEFLLAAILVVLIGLGVLLWICFLTLGLILQCASHVRNILELERGRPDA